MDSATTVCPKKKAGSEKPCSMRTICEFYKRCWDEIGIRREGDTA